MINSYVIFQQHIENLNLGASHVIEDTTNHVILDKDFEIDNGACSGEQTPTRRETPTKTKKAVFTGNQGFN